MFAPDLRLAFGLVDLAARLSVTAFEKRDFRVAEKPDGSLVTTVDDDIELALRRMIVRERPGDHIVGEEFGGDSDDGCCWYLDPIDGTTSFIDGGDQWGTLVALTRKGVVVAAVVDVPLRHRRYWAARGEGSFADGSRLRVSEVSRLVDASVCGDLVDTAHRRIPDDPLARLAERARTVPPDEGHSMLAVASGRADVALGSGGGPWDYAPFVLLAEEAGGRATDLDGQATFDRGSLLVTNGALHAECLAVVGG